MLGALSAHWRSTGPAVGVVSMTSWVPAGMAPPSTKICWLGIAELNVCGVALTTVACGCWRTNPDRLLKGRLQKLSRDSCAVIEQGSEAEGDYNRHEENHGVRFQFFSLMSLVR
jgi:hypothetical protein